MSSGDGDKPSPEKGSDGSSEESLFTEFRTAQQGPLLVAREVLTSVLIVAGIGFLLFSLSGVWPPMVAVESTSMDPNIHKGDLVFVTTPDRFAPDGADEIGVIGYQEAQQADYRKFGEYGSVVVFQTPSRQRSGQPPVIHRVHFHVEEGENWHDRADERYIDDENCEELPNCPAPHAGYITKGDDNAGYDQVRGISEPVDPAWVTGIAQVRVPFLGWIRLIISGAATVAPVGTITAGSVGAIAAGSAGAIALASRRGT